VNKDIDLNDLWYVKNCPSTSPKVRSKENLQPLYNIKEKSFLSLFCIKDVLNDSRSTITSIVSFYRSESKVQKHETEGPLNIPLSSISSDAGVSSSCIRAPSYKNLDGVKGRERKNKKVMSYRNIIRVLIYPIKDRVRTDPPYAIKERKEY
jgi:hypothetical protein